MSQHNKLKEKARNFSSSANSSESTKTTSPRDTKNREDVKTGTAFVPKTAFMRGLLRIHGLEILELSSEIPAGFRFDTTLEASAIDDDPQYTNL